MTHHHLDVVLAVGLVPVDALLEVVRPCAVMLLGHRAVVGSILSKPGVHGVSVAEFVEVYVVDRRDGEAVRQTYLGGTCAVEHVALGVVRVQLVVAQGVRLREVGASNADHASFTIVVAVDVRLLVIDDVAVGVADIQRIDGRHVRGGEHVAGAASRAIVAQVVAAIVAIAHVAAQFQPRLCLVAGVHARGETLVVRACGKSIV